MSNHCLSSIIFFELCMHPKYLDAFLLARLFVIKTLYASQVSGCFSNCKVRAREGQSAEHVCGVS